MGTASPAISFESLFTDIKLVMYILCKHPVSLWPFNTSVSDSRVTFRSVIYLCAVSWWLPHNVTMDTLVANRIYRYVGFFENTRLYLSEGATDWIRHEEVYEVHFRKDGLSSSISACHSLFVSLHRSISSHSIIIFLFFSDLISPVEKLSEHFFFAHLPSMWDLLSQWMLFRFSSLRTELWERVGLWWSLAWKAAVNTFLTPLILRDSLW